MYILREAILVHLKRLRWGRGDILCSETAGPTQFMRYKLEWDTQLSQRPLWSRCVFRQLEVPAETVVRKVVHSELRSWVPKPLLVNVMSLHYWTHEFGIHQPRWVSGNISLYTPNKFTSQQTKDHHKRSVIQWFSRAANLRCCQDFQLPFRQIKNPSVDSNLSYGRLLCEYFTLRYILHLLDNIGFNESLYGITIGFVSFRSEFRFFGKLYDRLEPTIEMCFSLIQALDRFLF